ncbi:MAG: lysoplasmalogenase [Cyclobacteriaceae bacterium]|nr:lysoplasmalogenase [Cyclobacteriaceae bacterium]
MKKIWLFLFVAVSVAELTAVTFHFQDVHSVVKPLIMPLLVAYFVSSVSARNYIFLAALVFCWAGDVLLMFQGELYFIFGLAAFLTGHLLYTISYKQLRNKAGNNELMPTQRIRFSLPIVLAGTGLVTILFPHLGGMKIPVMLYALVITVMAMFALFRYGFTSQKSFVLIFSGALFFMLSDSLLAINKFMEPFTLASLAIMTTYILAQYLIVEGAIAHEKQRN